jgi:hypothetical protein
MSELQRALFVAWQEPKNRRYFPVARLSQIDDADMRRYEFVYVRAALEANEVGFEPFVSFPSFGETYRSNELFPMFVNRMLSKSRPDFAEHIERLGLPSSDTSPIVVLARSGGRRATDKLELFPLPTFEAGHGYRTWFWSHGIRYMNDAAQ